MGQNGALRRPRAAPPGRAGASQAEPEPSLRRRWRSRLVESLGVRQPDGRGLGRGLDHPAAMASRHITLSDARGSARGSANRCEPSPEGIGEAVRREGGQEAHCGLRADGRMGPKDQPSALLAIVNRQLQALRRDANAHSDRAAPIGSFSRRGVRYRRCTPVRIHQGRCPSESEARATSRNVDTAR